MQADSLPSNSTATPGRGRFFRWLALAAILIVAVIYLWPRIAGQKAKYVTADVSAGNIQRTITATGALNPLVTVQVGSYVSGTVRALGCDFNTDVVVGTVCAKIDPIPFQVIVDQDSADLGISRAQLKKDQAANVYSKTAYDRDSQLLQQGSVSEDTVDSEKSAYDQGLAQIKLDEATIVQKQAELKAAQVNLGYTNIASPVVGTVITRSIDVGQTLASSLQTPTLFIIGKDLTTMQVDTNVSEADVGTARVGQRAFFSVQAFPTRKFWGEISQIRRGPITVQNVVTYDVVVRFDNPDRLLFPGMTADTHIVTDEHDDVLRVPLPAIRFTPEGIGKFPPHPSTGLTGQLAPVTSPATSTESGRAARPSEGPHRGGRGRGPNGGFPGAGGNRKPTEHFGRVWVLADGKLKSIPVTIGLDDGTLVEVSGGGLKAGDKVVVNVIRPGDQRQSARTPSLTPGLRPGAGPGPGQRF